MLQVNASVVDHLLRDAALQKSAIIRDRDEHTCLYGIFFSWVTQMYCVKA